MIIKLFLIRTLKRRRYFLSHDNKIKSFIRLRTACLWQAVPQLLAVDCPLKRTCESKSRGATADVACKLAWADNPDEYAEIIWIFL